MEKTVLSNVDDSAKLNEVDTALSILNLRDPAMRNFQSLGERPLRLAGILAEPAQLGT